MDTSMYNVVWQGEYSAEPFYAAQVLGHQATLDMVMFLLVLFTIWYKCKFPKEFKLCKGIPTCLIKINM